MTDHGPRRRLLAPLLLALLPIPARADDLSATDWKMKVDPPTVAVAAPASKDFAIPFPANFGGGGEAVYPSTPSPFVAIGKNAFDNDVRQIWDLSTRKVVGTFKGQIGFDDKTVALSPDGAYLAGKPTFRKTVEVRQTRNGRVAQSFDIDSPFLDFVDFAAGDRLVFGRLGDRKLQVCDIKSGDKVADLTLTREADREALAFSPGRAYLAAASGNDGTLRVYDLATGKEAGEAPTPKTNGQNVRCSGLAFSPDGAELAGLFEHFGTYRLVCWDAAEGKMLADFDLGKEIQKPPFYNARGIDWFPDKSAWLVMGHAIVDRAAGKKVWDLPFDSRNLKPGPRRFLDNDHALVITHEPSMSLRTAVIPRDKIAGAAKIVRAGGNASDASLPPLKPADWTGARAVVLAGKPGAWAATPEAPAAPVRLSSRPVALKSKAEDIRALLFPGAGSTQAFVVGTPRQHGQPNPTDGQARWVERFDLAGGRSLGRVDLPQVVDPIAVSPDGSALLLRETRARDRLDVVDAADGKPVVGWRPYEKESGEGRVVTWAAFLGTGRILTVSGGGVLVLWSVPDCKALYHLEDAFHGAPALSPGRKLLAGFDGKTLRVLDAETGALKGEGTAPTGLGVRPEWKAAAFRPDGQELVALFGNGSMVGWDLKTGRGAEARPTSPVPLAGPLEWSGENHVLLENRVLVDLRSRRVAWEYLGAPVGSVGPDGRHWFVTRGAAGPESGTLASIGLTDAGLEKAEALLADPRAPAVIRPGSKVSLQLNIAGPPKDAPGYRQALVQALTARLKANGLVVVDDGPPADRPNATRVSFVRAAGPDARLVLNAREKDTGQTIQYRRFGRLPRDLQVVKLVDLVCEMTLVDARGSISWAPPQTVVMQPFGFVLRMPAGETDPEVYLKKLQWDRVKDWATATGAPYFVAREGNEVVHLPGRTDLNAAFAK
jgi:WD40 repeat protein